MIASRNGHSTLSNGLFISSLSNSFPGKSVNNLLGNDDIVIDLPIKDECIMLLTDHRIQNSSKSIR